MKIKSYTNPKHYQVQIVEMRSHPALLFRASQPDKQDTRPRIIDISHHLGIFFTRQFAKRRAIGILYLYPWVFSLQKALKSLYCFRRTTIQPNRNTFFDSFVRDMQGQIWAIDALLVRVSQPAQHPDQRHPIGCHQGRRVDNALEFSRIVSFHHHVNIGSTDIASFASMRPGYYLAGCMLVTGRINSRFYNVRRAHFKQYNMKTISNVLYLFGIL